MSRFITLTSDIAEADIAVLQEFVSDSLCGRMRSWLASRRRRDVSASPVAASRCSRADDYSAAVRIEQRATAAW